VYPYPTVGKPVDLIVNISQGVPDYGVRWFDSDGLSINLGTTSDTTRTYRRVYQKTGKKAIVAVVTDSTPNKNQVFYCAKNYNEGPYIRVRPIFDEN
jgi:hypothetical protein